MSIFTTKKNVRALAEKDFSSLSNQEKKKISKINELAYHAQYGYTDCVVYDTPIGRVKCENYNDYCSLQSLATTNRSKAIERNYNRKLSRKKGK